MVAELRDLHLKCLAQMWGFASGLRGQSYALPTMTTHLEPLSLDEIKIHVDHLIKYAQFTPHLDFMVTAIGTGICGYKPEEIAPLFQDALNIKNIYLPELFIQILME